MRRASTTRADGHDVPELRRRQLGRGVRGRYCRRFVQGSNVVVLRPELLKVFPTSQAVNDALAGLLAVAQQIRSRANRPRTRGKARTG